MANHVPFRPNQAEDDLEALMAEILDEDPDAIVKIHQALERATARVRTFQDARSPALRVVPAPKPRLS